jgi:hypothetical protein
MGREYHRPGRRGVHKSRHRYFVYWAGKRESTTSDTIQVGGIPAVQTEGNLVATQGEFTCTGRRKPTCPVKKGVILSTKNYTKFRQREYTTPGMVFFNCQD